MKKKIKDLIVFIAILIAVIMIVGSVYYATNYADQDFEQILFYLFSGVEHTAGSVVDSVIIACIVPVVLLTLVLWIPTTKLTKTDNYIVLKFRKKEFKIRIYPCNIIRRFKKTYILLIFLIAIIVTISGFKVDKYISNRLQKTTIYEEYYVSKDDVKITYPENKRNLILIIAESMENSIGAIENGGAWKYSLIPELEKIAQENTNFSNTELIGGGLQTMGTSYTAGGMVGITSGNILRIINPTMKSKDIKFVGGAYTLGEILQEQGYNLEIMMGSDGSFGGRTQYFLTNGGYKIFDVNYAIETGKMTNSQRVWWGFEDDKLFEWSKEELTNLASQEKPFNYIMLTADTHFTDGYLSENAEKKYEKQYENVFAYSSKSIAEFLEWIQAQDFYQNTTVVIVGDHLGMQTEFYRDNIDGEYKRTTYNAIINSVEEDKNSKNRTFTTLDMFPTILASIGIKVEGERLAFGTNLYSGVPTLAEELGFSEFNSEVSKYSEYYNKKILEY